LGSLCICRYERRCELGAAVHQSRVARATRAGSPTRLRRRSHRFMVKRRRGGGRRRRCSAGARGERDGSWGQGSGGRAAHASAARDGAPLRGRCVGCTRKPKSGFCACTVQVCRRVQAGKRGHRMATRDRGRARQGAAAGGDSGPAPPAVEWGPAPPAVEWGPAPQAGGRGSAPQVGLGPNGRGRHMRAQVPRGNARQLARRPAPLRGGPGGGG
jgi:hypothetical protein